ncbi:hypothetical protein ACFWYW_57560 [Nonomuraea sp. NPDC059023]|uniref:hypothetical protein n=1 Tax=unclassified Nonomuraea TaxID=2593643 RepID=UPI00368CABDB
MSTLDSIAPYPKSEAEASAEAMSAAYAVTAQINFWLWRHESGEAAAQAQEAFDVFYGLTYVLWSLKKRAGTEVADEVARRLWTDLKQREALGPTLREVLAEYGIDPQAVDKIAEEFIAEDAQAGQERAQ